MIKKKVLIIMAVAIVLVIALVGISFAEYFSINPKSGTLTTLNVNNPSAEYVAENKLDIIQKVKPINLDKPAVMVNGVPISLKLVTLDVEIGLAAYTGTAKSILKGNVFPGISKERAQDIVSGNVDLRSDVTSEVLDRMIMQELYWQEAQNIGFDVGEEKAREYAIAEYERLKNFKKSDPQLYEENLIFYEIVLEVLCMTEEEHLKWTIDGRRRDLSIMELLDSMSEEEVAEYSAKLLSEADINYVNIP